jgi:hypothetical protein
MNEGADVTFSELEALILRMPGSEGNFTYRVAKLGPKQAEQWEQRLAADPEVAADSDVSKVFGPPVDLAEAMELIDTRDFRVLDLPEKQLQ